MNDNALEPLATANVSNRGVSFSEMGLNEQQRLAHKQTVERQTGLRFTTEEWLRAGSLGDIDLLIAKHRRLQGMA